METMEQLHQEPVKQVKTSVLFDGLNAQQKQAVCYTDGPVLIVAGAGTGKTTVVTRRIAYLIEQKFAKPDEILALTFTDKAAGEMQERLDLLLPLGYYDGWISTFHSFGERVLKTHALDIGLPNDFELLDQTRLWVLVYNNFEKFNLNYYKPLGNPGKFIDALISHFSKCKDELITPEEYLAYAQRLRLNTDSSVSTKVNGVTSKKSKKTDRSLPVLPIAPEIPGESADESEIARIEEVAEAYHVYQKLLLANNFLDFGDLINYTLDLFKRRPNILKYYQQKFKHVLVDEFQDTNFAQYQLVKMLSEDHGNIAVVGDDDQSIYKFRGASVSNILKFKADFPKLEEITLTENYRSVKEILDTAYRFIQQNNPDRLEIQLQIDKQLKPNSTQPGEVAVLEAPDLLSELQAVVKKILELKTDQNTWNDFAILLRSNKAAEQLLPVLENARIPHTFVASTGLYNKPIILDILAYLHLLDNVHDSFSLYRVLSIGLFQLSIHDIASLLEHSRKKTLTLYQGLEQLTIGTTISPEGKKHIELLLNLLHKHHLASQTRSVGEVAVEIIKDLALAKRVEADTIENAENRELVEQFYKKICTFEEQHADKSLHNFLTQLQLEQEAGDEGKINFNPDLGPESLKVMTVHGSKGLEFENVFVINMVDKRFPTVPKKDTIEIPKTLIKDILPEGDFHLQEERRLFYVAVTRAKRNLFFTWSRDYGGKTAKKPSQFLVEAGLVPSEKVSQATGKVVFNQPSHKTVEVFKILPERFSYSQLKDFETCPLKYKYQYYLKLPVPGSQYLSFGNTVHKVFEEYLKIFKYSAEFSQQDLFGKSKQAVSLPEFSVLEKLYQKNWIEEWYKDKKQRDQYYVQGLEMLKKFYDYSLRALPSPRYIEQSFILFIEKYRLVGRIDRADSTPDGLLIYDYKTGKLPKKTEKRDLDQLYIYQWAAQEHLKEKVGGLKYWYLNSAEQFLEEPLASPEELIKLKSELHNLMDKIVETVRYDRFAEEHARAKDHACDFAQLEQLH